MPDDISLAAVRLEIMQAIGLLTDRQGERFSKLEISMETLANTQKAWQESTSFRLTEIDRRMGKNEGAIEASQLLIKQTSEKARDAEAMLRSDVAMLREEVRQDRAKDQGGKDAIARLRSTITWVGGLVSVLLAVVAFVIAQAG